MHQPTKRLAVQLLTLFIALLITGCGGGGGGTTPAPAPTYAVTGSVTQSGTPVSGAVVTAVEPAVTTTTNSSGDFSLTLAATGTVTISVTNTTTTSPQITDSSQQVTVTETTPAQSIVVPPAVCGNGTIDGAEVCDLGTSNTNTACTAAYGSSCSYCNLSCQTQTVTGARCGDGTVHAANGETCDDSNTSSGDGCSATCQTEVVVPPTASCGNGTQEAGEACDSGAGNTNTACVAAYDSTCGYCNTSCQQITVTGPRCGDSVTNGAETCDNGASNTNTACTASYGSSCGYCNTSCQTQTVIGARCGDGTVHAANGEVCDDGNTTSGDGCSATCQTEAVAAQTYQGVKWGSTGSGANQYDNPRGMAVDSSGNVYVVDQNNNRVDVTDANGTHVAYIGPVIAGTTNLSGPEAVCVSKVDGTIAITEMDGSRVILISSARAYLREFGGLGTGDGYFHIPAGCVFDAANNIYVADDSSSPADTINHRIQEFDINGGFIRKWGSRGVLDGQFNRPKGVTLDSSGNIYVVESTNNRVQKFSSVGTWQMTWGGTGTGNGQFSFPYYVGIDSSNHIYVMDFGNNHVQVFSSLGTWLYNIGSSGSADGQFLQAVGIAVTSAGVVYVSDYNKDNVQKFTY